MIFKASVSGTADSRARRRWSCTCNTNLSGICVKRSVKGPLGGEIRTKLRRWFLLNLIVQKAPVFPRPCDTTIMTEPKKVQANFSEDEELFLSLKFSHSVLHRKTRKLTLLPMQGSKKRGKMCINSFIVKHRLLERQHNWTFCGKNENAGEERC